MATMLTTTMTMKKFLLPLTLLLSTVFPAHALTVNDVEIAPELNLKGETLELYGAGVRSKYFMKLYVGSLYSTKAGQNADQIISSENLTAVRLNVTSGMITSERMAESIEEGFENASHGLMAPLRERLNHFLAVFDAPIVEGDQFTLVIVPGVGVETYKNGELLDTTRGDDFSRTLLAVWFGDVPADKKLKKQMLGQ